MGDKTFLLADAVHINEKNFASLLSFCSTRNVDFVRPKFKTLPIDAFGNYAAHREVMSSHRAMLEKMSPDTLFEYSIDGVALFETCRAELMSLLIASSPKWRNQPLPETRRALFDNAFEFSNAELIDNMAAACLWIEFWSVTVKATPRLAYVGVFSGSLTYARALLEVMRFHPGRCFVMESFFTGMHFYCEERYTPISNHSDIRLKTVYRAIVKPLDRGAHEIKRNQVRAALQKIKNKNVNQPHATGVRLFKNDHPTLLILGQVLNDYSLLETLECGINSLDLYRQVIRKVLAETQWNVIYKAHPWERNKHNLRRAITLDELTDEFGRESRVALVEEHALPDLFNESDGVLCINSQSGIEAALAGFMPIQLGNAFWGGNGFSYDVDHRRLENILTILAIPAQCHADLAAYERLEAWLVAVIGEWLVEEALGAKADARLKKIFSEIAVRVPGMTGQASSKATDLQTGTANRGISAFTSPTHGTFQRKLRKFIRRPADFFRDAKSGVVRRLGLFVFGRAKS
jgi:hypothetical protein